MNLTATENASAETTSEPIKAAAHGSDNLWPLADQLARAGAAFSGSDVLDEEHSNAASTDDLGDLSRADANAVLRRVVGERITEARRLNGWDQSTFAQRIRLANSTQPSLWEQGKRLPPFQMLIEAARVLGVSTDYLLGESAEFDRDPKLAARAAAFRRVERLLKFNAETVAECLLDACTSPAGEELRIAKFSTRAHALCEAVERFQKLNAELFDEARGGATLLRTARELREALTQVDRFLQRSAHSRAHALSRARERTFDRAGASSAGISISQ